MSAAPHGLPAGWNDADWGALVVPVGDARPPLHRAIDDLTGALLTVQRLQRRADADAAAAADLRAVEQSLRDLGGYLRRLQDAR